MHPRILQTVEEALRKRGVQVIRLAAYRAEHFVLFQPRLKGVADILASPVGVMNQVRPRLPAKLSVFKF